MRRPTVVVSVALWWVAALHAARSAPINERVSNREGVVLLEEAEHPGDCLLGEWGAPGSCSAKCGGGLRTYRRAILRPQKEGGKPCDKLIKASACNVEVCSSGPEEKEAKTAKKKAALAKEQKESRTIFFAKQEKKVLAAQDTSRKALTAALEDGRAGLKASNDVAYVDLVNAVSGELKSYHDDKKKRDALIEKQVFAKRELFEKHVIDSVHSLKYGLMDKADHFEHNAMYRDKKLEAANQIAAAKAAAKTHRLIARHKKEMKIKKMMGPQLGESTSGVRELSSSGLVAADPGLSKASLRCGMCMKSCKTVECESFCHNHFCKDSNRPEEYLESWPGVTLGTAKEEPIEETDEDPDAPTAAQHAADKRKVEKKVYENQKKPDPDAVSFKQHEEDEQQAEKDVEKWDEDQAKKRKEKQVKTREKLTEQMQKKEAEKEAEQEEKEKEDSTAKDALDDKLIEMDLKRDTAKEGKKKKDEKSGGMTAKQRSLQRLREQEQEAKERVEEQHEQLESLAELDGQKKKVASQIQQSTEDVENLKLKKKLIVAQKEKLLAQAKYQEEMADADGMHATVSSEKSIKVKEKEATFKEKEHKGSKFTQLEKKSKYAAKHYKESLTNLQMEEQTAKFAAKEAEEKLKVSARVEELSARAAQVEKSTEKMDTQADDEAAQAQADAAMKALAQARDRAYKAQRHAAAVAKKIAATTPTPEGSFTIQAQADQDANRARHDYESAQANAQEAVKDLPSTDSSGGEMADAKKASKSAAQKAKEEALKALKEKKLCKKMEKEAEIACSGGGKGGRKTDSKGNGKGDGEADSKADGKGDAKADGKSKGDGKANGKGNGKSDGKGEVLLGERNDEKGRKEQGVSKVCKTATKKAESICKKVKKAMNEAEAGAIEANKRKAYIAQIYAAQVAQKEASGDATTLQVAQADEAAKEALKKANEVPDLDAAKKGKKFSAAEVKKIVSAEVQEVLDKAKLAKNMTNGTNCTNSSQGGENDANKEEVEELKQEVDEDVKADVDREGGALKEKAKEKGQKANRKEKSRKKALKKKTSKEGKAKTEAQKIIDIRVQKASAVLNKAHKAQMNAAKMAKMRHDDFESVSEQQVSDADEAADKAKEAAEVQAEVTALAIQCKAGHGKMLKLEKQLSGLGDNKAMKDFVEQKIVALTQEIATACKEEKKDTKKAGKDEKKAADEEAKVEAEMKKAETKAEEKKEEKEEEEIQGKSGSKAKGSGSGSGSGGPKKMEWKIIVEHGAITASFSGGDAMPASGESAAGAGGSSAGKHGTVGSADREPMPEEPRNKDEYNTVVSNGTITSALNYTHPDEMEKTKGEVTAEEIMRIRKVQHGLISLEKSKEQASEAAKNATGSALGSGVGSGAPAKPSGKTLGHR